MSTPSVMSDPYQTRDLNVAAYLVAAGFPLVRLDRDATEPRRRVFVFPPDASGVATRFYSGATIPARAYAVALRDLKALLSNSR